MSLRENGEDVNGQYNGKMQMTYFLKHMVANGLIFQVRLQSVFRCKPKGYKLQLTLFLYKDISE